MNNLLLAASNTVIGIGLGPTATSAASTLAQGAKDVCSTLAVKTHAVVSNVISSSTTKAVGMATSIFQSTVNPLINVGLTVYHTLAEDDVEAPSSKNDSSEQDEVQNAALEVLSEADEESDTEEVRGLTNDLMDMGALLTKEEVDAAQPSLRATPPSSPNSVSSEVADRQKVVTSSSTAAPGRKTILVLISPLLFVFTVLVALALFIIFVVAGPNWMEEKYKQFVKSGVVASVTHLDLIRP